MTDFKALLRKLRENRNTLEARKARWATDPPLGLLNQIADHKQAIDLTEQVIAGHLTEAQWREKLKPLLVAIDERAASSEICQVTLGDIGGDVRDAIIAGRDVHVTIYNYPPPPAPPVTDADTAPDDAPIAENPYRGLFAFRPEHSHLFFGRETFTRQLVQATTSRSLVAVLGASGSGKSSVVFAGLVPALLARSDAPWQFTTFRPGTDPFFGLAQALVPLIDPGLSKIKQTDEARDFAVRLREGRSRLADHLQTIHDNNPDRRLLIIADQFEELYTLCKDTDTHHAFLNLLLAALPTPNSPFTIHHSPFTIVLTLRADFLGQASLYRPLADALQGTTELLGPMTRSEMTEAIEKPAALHGVQFEANLVERLLDDVGQEEGSLP
ncbi:MAG: hypothetical protein R3264_01055, partial [Anaerolineae bacterium]|nr:hypothetical protein [Anaerolineae bacterium]